MCNLRRKPQRIKMLTFVNTKSLLSKLDIKLSE